MFGDTFKVKFSSSDAKSVFSFFFKQMNMILVIFYHVFTSAVPGELPSKFTTSKKPYIGSWFCEANGKMLVSKLCTIEKSEEKKNVFFSVRELCKEPGKNHIY